MKESGLLECLEERIEFINQLFSLSSKMLERDLRQDEFHGGRVYINIYIYTCGRDRFQQSKTRRMLENGRRREDWGRDGINGDCPFGVRGALSVISPVSRLML